MNFDRFGLGNQRRSHFTVEVNWIDVRGFIREFIEMGHPEAVYLQRILQLGKAIEDADWSSPSEEFWDVLP